MRRALTTDQWAQVRRAPPGRRTRAADAASATASAKARVAACTTTRVLRLQARGIRSCDVTRYSPRRRVGCARVGAAACARKTTNARARSPSSRATPRSSSRGPRADGRPDAPDDGISDAGAQRRADARRGHGPRARAQPRHRGRAAEPADSRTTTSSGCAPPTGPTLTSHVSVSARSCSRRPAS